MFIDAISTTKPGTSQPWRVGASRCSSICTGAEASSGLRSAQSGTMKRPPRRHHPVGIRAVCRVLYAPAGAERLSLGWCLSARGSVLYFSLVTQPWHEESRHGVVCSHSSSRVCYIPRFWWASLPKSDHMDIRTLAVPVNNQRSTFHPCPS